MALVESGTSILISEGVGLPEPVHCMVKLAPLTEWISFPFTVMSVVEAVVWATLAGWDSG